MFGHDLLNPICFRPSHEPLHKLVAGKRVQPNTPYQQDVYFLRIGPIGRQVTALNGQVLFLVGIL